MFLSPYLDLRVGGPSLWIVINQPLVWDDGRNNIEVPVGFVTDLATVPKFLRGVLDVNGRSRRPATLHDWLYNTQTLPRAECDDIFRRALLIEGEGISQWLYFAGVRAGGWAYWGRKGKAATTSISGEASQ
jgi:hypothetical protein